MKSKLKSEVIKDFLDLIDESKKLLPIYQEYQNLTEKAQQDLLHNIEFSSNAKERSKLATQLHNIRLDRRYYKDNVTELELVVNYFKNNDKACNQLKELLGKMRKEEDYHKNRKYKPRVFIDEKL